jgi:hypothetical protein
MASGAPISSRASACVFRFHTNWGVLGKGLYLHDFGRSQNGVRAGSLLEVRGGSGVHGSGAGATAIAGLQLYPGS